MSDLTDALRASCVQSLYALTGRPSEGIPDWLLTGDYKFDADVITERAFVLRDAAASVAKPVGYEVGRLATASFESIAGLEPNVLLKKSTAWLAIRSYYGAFFAAHALMRAFGVAIIKLEPPVAKRLCEVAGALSRLKVAKIESGYYVGNFATDVTTSEAVVTWRRRERKGGAHGLAWVIFGELLQRLGSEIIARTASSSPDRIVFKKLDSLRDAIKLGGNDCCWLSDMRNSINYNHPAGAWFPFTGKRKSEIDSLFRGATLWRSNAMLIDLAAGGPTDVQAFIKCCAFITAMCRELVEDISERHSSNVSSFVSYGPEALLAQMYPSRAS